VNGIALVLGGADCLWLDIGKLIALAEWGSIVARPGESFRFDHTTTIPLSLDRILPFEWAGELPAAIIATNAAGVYYPGHVDHWVTLHPEWWLGLPDSMPGWMDQRRIRGGNLDAVRWSDRGLPHWAQWNVDRITPRWRGTSGLLAVKVAVELGFPRIVLCGIPMEDRGHFDEPAKGFAGATTFQTEWRQVMHHFDGRVRSMSGWTRKVHGAPTREWLLEGATT
jgi:hypothetical protein